MIKRAFITAAVAALAAGSAHAADVAHGKKLYLQCASCHGMQGQGGSAGPSLKGIVGKTAGSQKGFFYSNAMKTSGVTWTEANLAAYVTAPQAKVKGSRMIFAGLKKPGDAEDVVAYVKTLK